MQKLSDLEFNGLLSKQNQKRGGATRSGKWMRTREKRNKKSRFELRRKDEYLRQNKYASINWDAVEMGRGLKRRKEIIEGVFVK